MAYDPHTEVDRGGMSVQETLYADQARVLEQIALGRPLRAILDAITRLVEAHAPETLCSILLLDESGQRLRLASAPNFPEAYNQAVDSIAVGDGIGSCGTAAFHKKPCIVRDIAIDPKCAQFKEIALTHGLRACWSSPIPLPGGRIAGTFAIYCREPRSPSVHHLELIETATHLAGIAVQREEAATTLGRKEEQLRAVVSNAPLVLFTLDKNGVFTLSEGRGLSALGLNPGEAVGKSVFELYREHSDTLTEIRAALAGEPRHHIATIGPVTFDTTFTPLFDETGVTGVLGVATNITDRLRADAAQRDSERRFRETFDRAAAGIAHKAPDGRILRANRKFCELLGYDEDELLTLRDQDITLPEDMRPQLEKMARLLRDEAETFKMEKRYVREDGSMLWGNLTMSLARDDWGRPEYFIGVVEDISERKRMQIDRDQLLLREQTARAQAEAANRSKDQLLAVVSHELRTPLTPILAAVGLLARDPELAAESKHLLATIKRNAELEARLIDDLLDLTRITNGKIRLNIEKVDAHTLINNAIDIYRNEIKSNGLELVLDLRAPERNLQADPARVQQVFWNLISNSVKFTPPGGRLSIRSSNPAPGRLRVEVTDTGSGIDTEVMKRLFSAFEQGEQFLTRRYGGLGLGLSISKALIELHGGSITARSDGKNRGTTFTIELPTTDGSPVKNGAAHEKRVLQILLVEDNRDTAGLMKRILNEFGHEATTAGSVHDALDLAQQQDFDLVISDIGLPDGSGWELMRQLREKDQGVKGIALSGFGSEEDARNSRDAGFLEHMVKPICIHKLEQVLQKMRT